MNLKRILALLMVLFCGFSILTACAVAEEGAQTQMQTGTQESVVSGLYKDDPAKDDAMNVLMIGNSFCYYYVEELYGMLTAAGYKNVNVCNVYYSGCPLESHWNWWKNGESNYEFYTTNESGRNKAVGTSLEYCLKQHNWDLISLQESTSKVRINGVETHLQISKVWRTELWERIKELFPQSRHVWHQSWSYQVGYNRNGYKMEDFAQQEQDMQLQRSYALAVCEELSLERVNTGEAWQIVREGGYDDLCARRSVNAGLGDFYHDGDIGGGQYLNACVWFEAITGQSCVGNTYRPDYDLDEALIETLQKAAHQAVADRNAEAN